jgi:hypothetical protein
MGLRKIGHEALNWNEQPRVQWQSLLWCYESSDLIDTQKYLNGLNKYLPLYLIPYTRELVCLVGWLGR